MNNLSDLREQLEQKSCQQLFGEIADGAYSSKPKHQELATRVYNEKLRRENAAEQARQSVIARRAMLAACVAAAAAVFSALVAIILLWNN